MFRALFFVLSALLLMSGKKTGKGHPPLRHEAYVWQHKWTQEMEGAIAHDTLPRQISGLKVLVGECGLGTGPRRIRVSWEALKQSRREVTLCIRAGTEGTLKVPNEPDLEETIKIVRHSLTECRKAGIEPRAVQIDYDCPERLLGQYAKVLGALRVTLDGCPLEITALPSWLDAPGFAALLAAVDGWTLQVHWTETPRLNQNTRLFESAKALKWTRKAGSFGKPFRVALPTYCYVAYFDKARKYVGVTAETLTAPRTAAYSLTMESDPVEIASFLEEVRSEDIETLTGVDWFRLPMPEDRLNWRMEGLAAVLEGKAGKTPPLIHTVKAGALYDLMVVNQSPYPSSPVKIGVLWKDNGVIAADGACGWQPALTKDGIEFAPDASALPLAPHESRPAGWVRMREQTPPFFQIR